MVDRHKLSPKDEIVAFGRNLRKMRVSADLTQEDVADIIGVSLQQYAKYERGVNAVTVHALVRIASALKVPPLDLLEYQNAGHD